MSSLLVLQVTKGTSQIEVAIYSTLCDYRPRLCYPINFNLTFWLVIDTHLNSFTSLSEDTAGISCVCYEYLFLRLVDVYDIAGTTN
jgi:hypothetical protein